MMGHKICFMKKYGLLSLNYPCYPFLSVAMKKQNSSTTMYMYTELGSNMLHLTNLCWHRWDVCNRRTNSGLFIHYME